MLIVAVKRTHKLHSKLLAKCCYAEEQLLSHVAASNSGIFDEFYQLVYFPAQLSARLKLHNVPALFIDIGCVLELPGVSHSHQAIPSRSYMWLHHRVASAHYKDWTTHQVRIEPFAKMVLAAPRSFLKDRAVPLALPRAAPDSALYPRQIHLHPV